MMIRTAVMNKEKKIVIPRREIEITPSSTTNQDAKADFSSTFLMAE
jgi:hypothetical protein